MSMQETRPAHMHVLLDKDERCEECGKTPREMEAERNLERHQAFVNGLHDLAAWWSDHPEVDIPYGAYTINLPVSSKEELAEIARAFGRCKKYGDDDWFGVRRQFGPISLDAYGSRENVCLRVVKGTREITRDVPDPGAPTVQVTETEEIVEWKCAPLLADAIDDETAEPTDDAIYNRHGVEGGIAYETGDTRGEHDRSL